MGQSGDVASACCSGAVLGHPQHRVAVLSANPLEYIVAKCPNLAALAIRNVNSQSSVKSDAIRRFFAQPMLPRLRYLALNVDEKTEGLFLEALANPEVHALEELRICLSHCAVTWMPTKRWRKSTFTTGIKTIATSVTILCGTMERFC